MKHFSLVKLVKEELIGSDNGPLAKAIIAFAVAVLAIGLYAASPNMSFQGIAGSRESNINFEYPVEIKRVQVISGQRIKRGDLLLELNQSDLDMRIRQLTAQLAKLKAEKSVRDQLNRAVGNNLSLDADPMSVEIQDLTLELQFLQRQRKNLYVFAEMDGIVGSVNFKRGEKAPGFSSLITISSESPTFVQGFIHEKMHSSVTVGSKVTVSPLSSGGHSVEGKVVSVGSRIVEIPTRISNSIALPVWGKEVIVEIPRDSQLLLGERVMIAPRSSFLPSLVAFAGSEDKKSKIEPKRITLPMSLDGRTKFEASGLIYLPDLKKYLVVSDDTDDNNSPWLFFLSEDGEVEDEPVVMPGLKEIIDMESISADGEQIYVMTSLSGKTDAAGKHKPERNLLVRFKRRGVDLTDTQTVDFGAWLRSAAQQSLSQGIRTWASDGIDSLEVEGHVVSKGVMYLLAKNPHAANGDVALLKVSDLESIFAGKAEPKSLELAGILNFKGEDGEVQLPSDIIVNGPGFLISTTCQGKSCGAIWSVRADLRPELVRVTKSDRPEGLAVNPARHSLMVTFDDGKQGSKYVSIPMPAVESP